MLQKESRLAIVDNSGALQILLISCLGGSRRRYARPGDVITATVKSAKPNQQIKKGDIVCALIVATTQATQRRNGSRIKCSLNCAIIVKKDEKKGYKPVGTRIFVPIMAELIRDEYKDIISLAPGTI